MDKDSGMTKYAVLPNEEQEVEIAAGAYKGQRGIVKQSSEGRLTIKLRDGNTVEVSEAACRTEK